MNSPPAFLFPARLLHWVMAALILFMLLIGFTMVASLADYHDLLSLHRPIGLAILCLAILRLAYRWRHPPPQLPDDLPKWQRKLAQVSHGILYGLMLALPLVGWAMLSAAQFPATLVGPIVLPPIMPEDPEAFAALRSLHSALAYSLAGVFLLHLAAALVHGFIRQDGVLSSMTSRRQSS